GKLVGKDPENDHDFSYWNRDGELPPKTFKPGKNLIAVFVKNHKGSHDLYMDLELTAQIPIPKPARKKESTAAIATAKPTETKRGPLVPDEPRDPDALTVDKTKKTV